MRWECVSCEWSRAVTVEAKMAVEVASKMWNGCEEMQTVRAAAQVGACGMVWSGVKVGWPAV